MLIVDLIIILFYLKLEFYCIEVMNYLNVVSYDLFYNQNNELISSLTIFVRIKMIYCYVGLIYRNYCKNQKRNIIMVEEKKKLLNIIL